MSNDQMLLEAFKWVKTHYNARAGIDDADELLSYLTTELVKCSQTFDPNKGEWEHYYRSTIHHSFQNYRRQEARRFKGTYHSDDGDFEHTSPELRTDELVMLADLLSKISPEEDRILAAIHSGVPRKQLPEHLGMSKAAFYRHYLRLRHKVRTMRRE